jgi:hypothetical protein
MFWLVDCIAHKLADNMPKDMPHFTHNEFQALDALSSLPRLEVELTDREIMRILGIGKSLTGWKIAQLASRLNKMPIDGEAPLFYDPQTRRYCKIGIHGIFAEVLFKEDGMLSKRKGVPIEHKKARQYRIILGIGGLLMFHGLSLRRFALLPQRFYKLSLEAQMLYRRISLWRHSTIPLAQAAALAAYKTTDAKKQRRRLRKHFEALKAGGFINDWKEQGRGADTLYIINCPRFAPLRPIHVEPQPEACKQLPAAV